MNRKLKLLIIAGPTGSGKSELAVKAARLLNGEIISVDSMQVYRHFDIGTAKPTQRMLEEIPHHLINIAEPNERFTMWDFRLAAQKAIEEISSRNKKVLLVGGTGLYMKTLLENLDGGAKPDPQLRAELNEELATKGLPFLYEKLQTLNPEKAEKIHPNDKYRIVRALESGFGPPISSTVEKQPYEAAFFVLGGPRKLLYERINQRVVDMFKKDWIGETHSILSMGFDKNCKPFQSLGYKQIISFLDGRLGKEELVPTVQKETRRYAKRQITWFARVNNAVWADSISDCGDSGGSLAGFMAKRFARQR
ncbi:MAG: tRNA (adenosine(37)-N6)-dimethylallyltransferase MiaA [Nitrospinota bacterium]